MTLPFPDIHIYQYDTSEVASPSGQRHIEGGSFAFRRRVGLGCLTYGAVGTSGTMMFDDIKINVAAPQSEYASRVAALTFRVAKSGVGISNMRLYLTDNDALTQPAADVGSPPAFVQVTSSGTWQPNALLPSGTGDVLATSLAGAHVVRRQDGEGYLAATSDKDVSQFVFLNLVVPIDFPKGNFGVCGSGLLRFNFVFDYFDAEQFLQFGEP